MSHSEKWTAAKAARKAKRAADPAIARKAKAHRDKVLMDLEIDYEAALDENRAGQSILRIRN